MMAIVFMHFPKNGFSSVLLENDNLGRGACSPSVEVYSLQMKLLCFVFEPFQGLTVAELWVFVGD
jgi:hypothetical protein